MAVLTAKSFASPSIESSRYKEVHANEHFVSDLNYRDKIEKLLDLNIGQLLDGQSGHDFEKIALKSRWQAQSLTYGKLHESSRDIAQRLLSHGVRPKDCIVVLSGNSTEYVQLFFAAGGIGAIFAIINPNFAQHEVISAVEFLEPKIVFVSERIGYRKYTALLNQFAERPNSPPIVQLGPSKKPLSHVTTWKDFCQQDVSGAPAELLTQHWARCDPDDVLCIQFTSGTTGPRKAAMVSHSNLLNNAFLVGKRLETTPTDVVCCNAPINHCFGLVCGLLLAAVYGCSAVIPSDVFIAEATLSALSEDQCTIMLGVSSMFEALLDHPDAAVHAPSLRLRTGIIAGSSFSRNLLVRLQTEFRFTGLAYGYGMTEASCIVFLTRPARESLLDDHTSVGTVISYAQAKVVDSELNELPPGSAGELMLSGCLVFRGYYKNPEKTAETLVKDSTGQTWLRTGDLVRIDTAGRGTIVGRVKDMIKKGGENIFPVDIETVLESHPDINVAAVVGIPDPYWGEIIGAFVQRAEGALSDTATRNKLLKSWVRSHLDPQKVPDHWFWLGDGMGIPDQLPVSNTGKIEKLKLRAAASDILLSQDTHE